MNDKDILKRFNGAQDSLVIQQSDFSLKAINDMVIDNSIDQYICQRMIMVFIV
jgi:hypothetical protein